MRKILIPFLLLISVAGLAQQNPQFRTVQFLNPAGFDSTLITTDGIMWYNHTTDKFRFRENGVMKSLGSGSGSGITDGDKGDITVSSSGATLTVDNTAITYAKFQNLTGLSIFGRSANSSGVGADITAGSDGDVLRRSGTTLGFGAIPISSVTNLQTTIDAKVADAINNGTTTIAPSQNAVFDAIALKWGSLTTFRRLIASASLDATDLTNVNSGARYWIEMNSGSANTLTIVANSTQAFPIGATIKVSQYGGGTTSFVAAGGVTLRSSSGVLTIGNQFSTGILTKVDTDEWYLENGSPTVLSSTYTPTLTNVTNVAASTAYVTGYYRIGNAVTVYGKIDIDATLAASSATEVGISLPVASAMTLEEDLGGNAISDAVASLTARIKADATNDRASVVFKAISLTNDSYSFEFSYTVK